MSKAAALESFASKAPFKAFQSCALAAYVEHGLRDLPGESDPACIPCQHSPIEEFIVLARVRSFEMLQESMMCTLCNTCSATLFQHSL